MVKYLRISSNIRKPLLINDFAITHEFPKYEENLIFFFISVQTEQQVFITFFETNYLNFRL